MADPATQFQQAGLNVPYNYQHVVTQLPPPIRLEGSGALWAQVGQTAMAASQMLQNTAGINPQIRAQMKEQIERSQLGIKAMKFAEAHPKWARATVGEGSGGATMVAPITQPVAQQTAEGIDWNADDDSGDQQQKQQQQPTITRTGTNTGVDQNGKQYHETTPGSNQWKLGPVAPAPPTNLNQGMAQGGLVRGYAPGGHVADKSDSSSDIADYERRMAQERQAVLGAPAGTFLNPATGSYEPLQTQAPPPTTPSPGMFAGRAPAPPPAPTGQPQTNQPGNMLLQGAQPQDQTPGSAISQVTQQPGVALADWQNQNVHPVIAPKQVLDAVRTNVTTQAQDATYLPNGGVNGEPAWAIHMKGGGQTTISASQLAQQPWGRALMASHNLSEVFEAQNQGQPQPGQQPGQQPYPTIASDQGGPQGQPPAAPGPPGPTPMPSGTGAGAPQGSPAASTGYNPAAYQMPQGPTITQAGEVNPALMAGGTDAQAAAAAKAAGKPGTGTEVPVETSPDEVAKMNADAASNNPNLDWKLDEKGKKYIGNQDPQHPFWEQRFYPLTGGFQTGPWTAENIRKQQLLEEFGGPAGVPIKDEKTGKPMVINADTINGLSPEEQDRWLAYARDFKLHTKAPLSTEPEGQNLANNANAVAAAQRIKDKLLYMKANNIPMSAISQDELIRSQEAGWAEAAGRDSSPAGAIWNFLAQAGPRNNFADELGSDYKLLNAYLAKVQGGHYPDAATPKPEQWDFELPIPTTGSKIGIPPFPKTTDVSNIAALNKIGSGDNHDQAIAHIQEVLDNAKDDYKKAAAKLGPAGYRVPDVDKKNLYDLDNEGKGYIDDQTNLIWDKNHQKMVNGYGQIPVNQGFFKWTKSGGGEQSAGASPSPSPTLPQITDWDTKQLDKLGVRKGDSFTGPDGKPYTRTK